MPGISGFAKMEFFADFHSYPKCSVGVIMHGYRIAVIYPHILLKIYHQAFRSGMFPPSFNLLKHLSNKYSPTGKERRCLPYRRRGRFAYAQAWPSPRACRSRRPRTAAEDGARYVGGMNESANRHLNKPKKLASRLKRLAQPAESLLHPAKGLPQLMEGLPQPVKGLLHPAGEFTSSRERFTTTHGRFTATRGRFTSSRRRVYFIPREVYHNSRKVYHNPRKVYFIPQESLLHPAKGLP
jgi:hypothetical protein